MPQNVVITIDDTTALASSALILELGFQPDWVEVENVTETDKTILKWNRTMLETAAIAGGISTPQIGTMSGTARTAAATTGIQMYAGGETIKYNNPLTPTYTNQDDTAVTAGTIRDVDGDVLAREMPAKLSASSNNFYKSYVTKPGIILSTLADLRGDGETIRVTAGLRENAPDGV